MIPWEDASCPTWRIRVLGLFEDGGGGDVPRGDCFAGKSRRVARGKGFPVLKDWAMSLSPRAGLKRKNGNTALHTAALASRARGAENQQRRGGDEANGAFIVQSSGAVPRGISFMRGGWCGIAWGRAAG